MSKDYSQMASLESLNATQSALEEHGFKVLVVETLADAKAAVLNAIPAQAEVFTATSVTLDAAGISQELNESGQYTSLRPQVVALMGQPDKSTEMKRLGSVSQYTVGSAHAVTEDGQLLVASASGSQLPNYVFGAANLILVIGSQKIVKDLPEALDRIEQYTYQLEDARALKAYNMHSSLNKILIYRKETGQRVLVILVKEVAGF